MAARLEPSREELLEVNICDRSVGSEEESGVFSHSTEDFCGFQQWTHNDTSSSSSSSPSSRPEELRDPEPAAPRSSIVDRLLVELYDAFSGGGGRRTADSWDSSTGSGSDTLPARSNSGCGFLQELQERHTRRLQMTYLAQKGERGRAVAGGPCAVRKGLLSGSDQNPVLKLKLQKVIMWI